MLMFQNVFLPFVLAGSLVHWNFTESLLHSGNVAKKSLMAFDAGLPFHPSQVMDYTIHSERLGTSSI